MQVNILINTIPDPKCIDAEKGHHLMRRNREIFAVVVTLLFLLIACCSTTTLDSVWRDPNYQGGKLKKVLVIGVAREETNRRLFEDKFVAQLKTYGTDAIASYTIIPSTEKLDKATVENEIKTLRLGAVLITQLVNIKKKTDYVPIASYPAGPYQSGWYGGYSRSYENVSAPGYNVEYEVVSLETRIYDTREEKLIWSGLSRTDLEGSVGSAIESLIKVLIKNLSDNKLI
jgi:hypothetical protein